MATYGGDDKNNIIYGDIYNDGGYADLIYGYGGDDKLYGMSLSDTLYGGEGNDYLDGGNESDILYGGAGDDHLYGRGGADTLFGEGGNDTIHLETYTYSRYDDCFLDVVEAGEGDDTIIVDASYFGGGPKSLSGGAGTDTLIAGGNLDLTTISGIERLELGGYNNLSISAANLNSFSTISFNKYGAFVTVTGGGIIGRNFTDDMFPATSDRYYCIVLDIYGNSTVDFAHIKYAVTIRSNNNTNEKSLLIGGKGSDNIGGGYGNDILQGNDGNDSLSGSQGDDRVEGGSGDDFVSGGTGDDILDGGVGADTMRGGSGNDRFIVDDAKDVIEEYLEDAGTDTVTVAFSYTLSDGVENLELTGSAAIDGTGNAQANTLIGNAAVNTLRGGAGDDILDGGGGNDILEGGLGNDRYVIDSARDVVSERANEGIDTIVSSLTYTLAAEFERLELIGAAEINGTGNAGANTLVGNEADNILRGGDGDDVLEGGGGNDTLYGSFDRDSSSGRDTLRGGAGDDYMFGGGGADTFDGGEGYDTVTLGVAIEGADTPATIDLADPTKNAGKAEGEHYVSIEHFQLGNAGDTFWADPLSSVGLEIEGYGGNDRITTAGGNDHLDGGAGADRLEGGAGDDVYVVDDAGDVVVEASGGGLDAVFASISYALVGDTVENILLTGTGDIDATGAAGYNALIGNVGNNILDGRQGADTMAGDAGDDTFLVDNGGDRVFENVGDGTDTVLTAISYRLAAEQEIEVLRAANAAATGKLTLIGNEFANALFGNAGANTLDGAAGADVLTGLAGNDLYRIDNGGDRVVEAVGGGRDTVLTTISYKLADGQEIEVLQATDTAGTAKMTLVGNAFAQTLTGNAGANTLDGAAGADTLIGLKGNDLYRIDNGGDRVVEAVGGGQDTVLTAISHALTAGQEIEILATQNAAGTAALNLFGNAFANTIRGNAGKNLLNGREGADVLTGGAGADTFVFDTALSSGNVDRITDFAPVDDTIRLSKTIFSDLATGPLAASAFKDIAQAGRDADDRILYDSRNGKLFYDVDGSGKGAAVQFAVLDNKAAITHADFVV